MTETKPATRTATATPTQGANANATVSADQKTMAAVAYILTWITGLIVLMTAKKEEKFKRWHAIQAIGLGIVFMVLYILVNVVLTGMVYADATGGMAFLWFGLSNLVYLLTFVLVIVCAMKAYQGGQVRLPLIAGIADKNA